MNVKRLWNSILLTASAYNYKQIRYNILYPWLPFKIWCAQKNILHHIFFFFIRKYGSFFPNKIVSSVKKAVDLLGPCLNSICLQLSPLDAFLCEPVIFAPFLIGQCDGHLRQIAKKLFDQFQPNLQRRYAYISTCFSKSFSLLPLLVFSSGRI